MPSEAGIWRPGCGSSPDHSVSCFHLTLALSGCLPVYLVCVCIPLFSSHILFLSCSLSPCPSGSGPSPPAAVPEGRLPAPGGLPHPAAHPGRHAALLLPLRCTAGAAAGLSDRGKACPATPCHLLHQTHWQAFLSIARFQPVPCWACMACPYPIAAPGPVLEEPGGPLQQVHTDALVLPFPADLYHWGEEDRDLHSFPGTGSLCCHSCHQGFRWVLLSLGGNRWGEWRGGPERQGPGEQGHKETEF